MKNDTRKICPACGNAYDGAPAISRKDNKTEICPLCGELEAMQAFFAFRSKQKAILKSKKQKEQING